MGTVTMQYMNKQNWEENEFQDKIRIKREKLEYIKKIRGTTSQARKLDEIIEFFKKHNKE